jgi:hypothetical protein
MANSHLQNGKLQLPGGWERYDNTSAHSFAVFNGDVLLLLANLIIVFIYSALRLYTLAACSSYCHYMYSQKRNKSASILMVYKAIFIENFDFGTSKSRGSVPPLPLYSPKVTPM